MKTLTFYGSGVFAFLVALLFLIGPTACNGPNGDECKLTPAQCLNGVLNLDYCRCECPEAPPPCLECPPEYPKLIKSDLKWECVKEQPPPNGPEPEDYITVDGAGKLGEGERWCDDATLRLKTLCVAEVNIMNDGIRTAEYALERCRDDLPGPWPIESVEHLEEILAANWKARNRDLYFMGELQKVNWRCDKNDPYYKRFCGRTDCRRAWLKEFEHGQLKIAIEWSEKLNGMKGWCSEL